MSPTSHIEISGIETRALAAAFRYITDLTSAYWDAQLDGRLSRFVAPPPEVEETIIRMTEDIWKAVGEAVRSASETASIRSSLSPGRMVVALDTASRMLAFVPYAREAGVDVPEDWESHTLLVYIIEELIATAKARLANSRRGI